MKTYNYSFNNKIRVCVKCGKNYKPKSPVQKYCAKCRKGMVKDGTYGKAYGNRRKVLKGE